MRVPESEKAVLGAMMIEQEAADIALRLLEPSFFYEPYHAKIFEAIGNIRRKGKIPDPVLVADFLRLEKVNSQTADLTRMVDICVHAGRVNQYVSEVRKAHLDRKINIQINQIIKSNPDEKLPLTDELRKLCVKRESEDVKRFYTMSEGLHSTLDELDNEKVDGIELGFPCIDELLLGVIPGDVLTLAGRTGVGKTAFLTKATLNMAQMGVKILFFACEMAEKQIALRMLPIMARVESRKMRTKKFDAGDYDKVLDAAAKMEKLPLSICGLPSPSLEDIEVSSFSAKADFIVIDYLQRCTLPKEESYRLRVSEFMRRLKNFALSRNVGVLLGCQLSRDLDREKRPPVLADLRESGTIEDESDQVVFIWIPEPKEEREDYVELECIVGKNRHGPKGVKKLDFDKTYMDITEGGSYANSNFER